MRKFKALSIFFLGLLVFSFVFTKSVLAVSWTSAFNVSNSSVNSAIPKVVTDGNGTIHSVWCEYDSGNSGMFYSYKVTGGSWSTRSRISTGNCQDSSLIVSSDNTVHLAWEDESTGGFDIFYAAKPSAGSWTTPVDVSGGCGADCNVYNPSIVSASDGTLYLSWYSASSQRPYYASKTSSGGWSSPSMIVDDRLGGISMTIDSNDTLHLVGVLADHNGSDQNTYYLTKTSGGSWSSPALISDCSGTSANCAFPEITAHGITIHVIWHRTANWPSEFDLIYVSKVGSGSWSSPVNISNNSGTSYLYRGGMATDSSGNLHVVWQDDTSGNREAYYSELTGSTWSSPVNLTNTSNESYYPALALDGSGYVHLVWDESNGSFGQIYYITDAPQRPTIGANLSAYVQPSGSACNINVPADYSTIQAAIDAASNGNTICVAAGVYNQTTSDVVINKSITLAGAGLTQSTINGWNSNNNSNGGVIITADNVTLEGFRINGSGLVQMALSMEPGFGNATVQYNRIVSGNGAFAIRDNGQRNGDIIQNNVFEGNNSSQIVFYAHDNASNNQSIVYNTFIGTGNGGLLFGFGATNSFIKRNVFSTSNITDLMDISFTPNEVTQNNFNSTVSTIIHLGGGNVTALNAQNNWWGIASDPSSYIQSGPVDSSNFELSAFPEYSISLTSDADPVVSNITASSTVNLNSSLSATANFTDSDITDTHTAVWNWGDGHVTSGTVTESSGSGSVTDSHTYTTAGNYTITLTVIDNNNGSGENTKAVTVLPTAISASADTYLNFYAQNNNEGSSPLLRIEGSANYRTLVKFDESQIEAAVGNFTNYTAKVRLTIVANGNNWGSTGRTIDLHRFNVNWAEGDGYINGNSTPNRGTGSGATWKCATDTNISNNTKDCSGGNVWDMNNSASWPFNSTPTATQNIINHQSGVVEFDVTSDVQSFLSSTNPNYGWIIKKTDEGVSGKIDFGTKEASLSPVLVITPQ